MADRARGLAYGGIGAMHLLAKRTGLVKAIDDDLRLLKLPANARRGWISHIKASGATILC
jgi:hypothetical protein